MIPVVVSTYPENGSQDVVLNSPIKVVFADAIDSATAVAKNIKLTNLNDGRDIPLAIALQSDTLTLTPADNEYGNMLLGSTEYKLVIANLSDPTGNLMIGTYLLEFRTVSDTINDVIPEPDTPSIALEAINFYPKQESYGITPASVKVKFNKTIAAGTNDMMILTTDTITDVDDIDFIDYTTVAGTVSNQGDNILVFTPTAALLDNKLYTVILKGVQVQGSTETLPAMFYTFYTKIDPMYATLEEIKTTYASLAPLIDQANPLDILKLIKENSEMARWIATRAEVENIDWDNPAKYVVEYVKSKTRYDIVFDTYIKMSASATAKTLGDLTIEYGGSLADLLDLADKLKMTYMYWESLIKGGTGHVAPKPFRKGEDVDEDPEYKNRQFRDIDGNKSWDAST